MYEFTGKVRRINPVQTFANGFTKRELVLEEQHGDWTNCIAFQFKKEKASLLDGVTVGSSVKVRFVIDGREWTDQTRGGVRCFVDLTGLELEVVTSADGASAKVGTIVAAGAVSEDVPF